MLKKIALIILTFVLCLSTFSCKKEDPPQKNQDGQDENENLILLQFSEMKTSEEYALMHTSMGDIKIRFFPEQAPKAVENFITHAKNKYYDGLKFHKVIEGMLLQSGSPDGTSRGGESIYGSLFEDEFSYQLYNFRGSLSMANNLTANTNGSQFFIVQAKSARYSKQTMIDNGWPEEAAQKYAEIGGIPWLDQAHTVFGFVFEGMDIVDAIAAVEKDPDLIDESSGSLYSPLVDVIIESIEILKY